MGGDVVQEHRPGLLPRLLIPAVLVKADDCPQGGEITEIDVGQIDVQDARAVGGSEQGGGQLGDAGKVDLAGQDDLYRISTVGDGENVVIDVD